MAVPACWAAERPARPGKAWAEAPDVPLQDAQRALRLVRSLAEAHHTDPGRTGIAGFSAGGHLAASLETGFDRPVYAPIDAIDQHSARPDFCALLYPVISMDAPTAHVGSVQELLGSDPSEALRARYSPQQHVGSTVPPTFIVHASDDRSVPVDNSLMMYTALRAAGIPVEMHLFERGGHGFGLRIPAALPVAHWPTLFLAWLDALPPNTPVPP